MSIARMAGVIGWAALMSACGGSGNGGDGSGSRAAYTVAAVPFGVDGAEADLDLSDPDAVLGAALSAILAATSITTGHIGSFDDGATPPGRGLFPCSAGSISESVAVDAASGVRTVTLSTSQCFDAQSDGVQNGVVEIAYAQPAAEQARGVLQLGAGSSPFLFGLPDEGEADYTFRQARGSIDFDGDFDGSPTTSSTSGLSLTFGKGARPFGSAALTPDRQIEVLAGVPGFELSVDSVTAGGTDRIDFAGRLFLAGSGVRLDPACGFEAGFDVFSNNTLLIGEDDDVVRGGMLTLSTAGGSATVQFDASGNAQVDIGIGTPRTYPSNIVRSFCGL